MKPVRKITIAIAIVALTLACIRDARSDENQSAAPAAEAVPAEEQFEMEIIPAAKIPVHGANNVDATNYARIYRSIPFNRAEYRANPNYRHDATMEILTGHPHHQTVIQHNFEHKQPVQRNSQPARPSRLLTPVSGPWFWGFPNWFVGNAAW